ncbi:MAG: hypothetical protein ACLFWG_11900, partial [Longimicrobiales bacterium]
MVFFIPAGASLEVDALGRVGWMAGAYVLRRGVGTALGPVVASRLTGLEIEKAHWLGLALLPQAGVALGLALAASIRFPEVGPSILNVVVVAPVERTHDRRTGLRGTGARARERNRSLGRRHLR